MNTIATKPIQRRFELGPDSERHPLVLLDTAKSRLRRNEDQVLYLIQDKQLVAFDLSLHSARNLYPAVWWPSLEVLRHRLLTGEESFAFDAAPETQVVVDDLLPARPQIRLAELALALCLSRKHIHKLISLGRLAKVPGTGNTINQAALIFRSSVLQFLSARRM